MNAPERPSAARLLGMMNERELSSEDLTAETLARIEAVNPALNAVVDMDREDALKQAKLADEARRKGSGKRLLGLPITLKDSIDAVGFRCTGGSYARENYKPQTDATVVARLRAAGAIIIAKTNLPEYSSSYETDSALLGRCNHPQDEQRTPGGSSGGEGALLGADASIVGIGIDGGGSIRVPSHYCGTVGLRPTPGRVPDTGTWPITRDTGYRDLMCVGPMARYVEDLELILDVIAGPDNLDPYAVPAPLKGSADIDLESLRIGWFDSDGLTPVSEETCAAIATAVDVLESAGATLSVARLPDISAATPIFFGLAGADGGQRTLADIAAAQGRHHPQFAALLEGFGKSATASQFFDIQSDLFEFRARMRSWMSANFDVLIGPVTTGPAPLHGEPSWGVSKDEYFSYRGFNYTHAFSLAGMPVAVVPTGEQDGLPLGVQIIAPPWREDLALAAASCIEQRLNA